MKSAHTAELRRIGQIKAKRHFVCPKCSAALHCNEGSFKTHKFYCADREERFWARVDKNGPNGCWIWLGCRDKWGYGDMSVRSKHIQSHRFAWKLLRGDPGKLDCLHKCDNPPCCNPDHIYLGTDADNIRDMHARGRALVGERSPKAKLTEAAVRAIRREYNGSTRGKPSNAAELAARYGVRRGTIVQVAKGTLWAHLK